MGYIVNGVSKYLNGTTFSYPTIPVTSQALVGRTLTVHRAVSKVLVATLESENRRGKELATLPYNADGLGFQALFQRMNGILDKTLTFLFPNTGILVRVQIKEFNDQLKI